MSCFASIIREMRAKVHFVMLIGGCLTVTLVAASGCGSGESSTSTISKASFVKRAERICAATTEAVQTEGPIELEKLVDADGVSGKEAEALLIRDWLVPLIRAELDEIRELGTPTGGEDRVEAVLSSLEEVIDRAEEDPRKYLDEQVNFERPYREAEKLAAEYGIPDCGQP
jgi:hypothetical protein